MHHSSPQPSPDSSSAEVIRHLHGDLKNFQQRLVACEFQQEQRLAAVPHIVWIADENGSATHFNPRWYEYTGLSEAESSNWSFLKAIHPEGEGEQVSRWAGEQGRQGRWRR